MRRLRIYVDTSVFGGCFDDEFANDSKRFFKMIQEKGHVVLISETVEAEIFSAPQNVQDVLSGLPPENLVRVPYDREVEYLRDRDISKLEYFWLLPSTMPLM